MKNTKIAIGAFVLAIVVGVLFVKAGRGGGDTSITVPDVEAGVQIGENSAEGRGSKIRGPVETISRSSQGESSQEGEVQVQDEFGGGWRVCGDGELTLISGDETLEMPIVSGKWKCPPNAAAPFKIGRIIENGRVLSVLPGEEQELSVGAGVVRCYSYPGAFVRAIREDGASLERWIFWRGPVNKRVGATFGHPGNIVGWKRFDVANESELYVPIGGEGHGEFWLGSDGYEWARVETQSLAMGELITKRLRQSGGLEVRVSNFSPGKGLRILLKEKATNVIYTEYHLHAEGFATLSGVRPGIYEVYLSFNSSGNVAVSDKKIITIVPAETCKIDIGAVELGDAATFGSVDMYLSVHGLSLWRQSPGALEALIVRVRPLENSPTFESLSRRQKSRGLGSLGVKENTDDDSVLVFWDLGSFPPGEYSVNVSPLGLEERFSVSTKEHVRVDIELPGQSNRSCVNSHSVSMLR
ncbi:MAG: hypothetical protein H6827_00570 [Planctomycetes bacterium]|nr:hypothetical protein [Planctomycetota bacterium]